MVVWTQGLLGGSGRPDLVIDYKDAGGAARRILSEHKVDALLTDLQRTAYSDWECEAKVLIAPSIERYRDAGFDRYATWLQIAKQIVLLGERCGGSAWREQAHTPESPSRLRLLEELLSYIERQNVGVTSMSAITDSTIATYSAQPKTLAVLETFLALVNEHPLLQEQRASDLVPDVKRASWWFTLEASSWSCLDELGLEYGAQISLEPTVVDSYDGIDEPALRAGFYFPTPDGKLPEHLSAITSVASAIRDAHATLELHENRKQGLCVKSLPLTTIAQHGATLPEQADYAATWAIGAIRDLAAIR